MHNQVPRRSTARLRSIDSSGISAVSRLLSALDISADHHHFRARSDESVGRGEADTVGPAGDRSHSRFDAPPTRDWIYPYLARVMPAAAG